LFRIELSGHLAPTVTSGRVLEYMYLTLNSRIMATATSNTLVQWPSELLFFTVLEPKLSIMGPRLGSIALKGRIPMQTPHYIALSSRGAVPHLSQDIMKKHTSITGVHVALEDCERPLAGLLAL